MTMRRASYTTASGGELPFPTPLSIANRPALRQIGRRATLALSVHSGLSMRAFLFSLALLAAGGQAHAQLTIRSGSGADASAIAAVRDQFRVDLGGGTTAGANGSFGGLRREINWDGVPAAFAAPNTLPANFFNANSPRGVVLSTPGTAFQVSGATIDSGAGQPAPARFGNLNVTYTATFQAFSPLRLFTPLDSNVFDLQFFLPGTSTPAAVKGFGLVVTDVDLANTTMVRFFTAGDTSVGVFALPAFNGGFSFLGGSVGAGQAGITRVRVTLGNTAAGPSNDGSADIVVADDFIYGEPAEVSLFKNGFEGT